MGVVYRARHRETGATVAIKTVEAQAADILSNIRREIHALRRASHPGLIEVLDHGVEGDGPWFAMELLEGHTLREHLDSDAPKDRASLVGIVSALCAPLASLHQRGLVHRDLKPENVFVCRDQRVVLMDLGLAQPFPGAGREELVASDGAGTLAYVSPEQLLGGFVDARADLFSLGCILFECLAGKALADITFGSSPFWQLGGSPPPPSAFAAGVPAELDALTLRLLARNPVDRFGYASDLANVLAPHARPRLGSVAAVSEPYLYRAPVVGRDETIDRLSRAVRDAEASRGSFVALIGESGSGKTRIALEVLEIANSRDTGAIAASGAQAGDFAYAREGAGPLSLFRPFFRLLAGYLAVAAPAARERVSVVLGPLTPFEPGLARFVRESESGLLLDERASRERLLSAVVSTLLAFARERPLALVLDDLQWADELSLDALLRLADGRLASEPLTVIAAWRAEEETPALERLAELPAVDRCAMGLLDEHGVGKMIAGMLSLTAPPASLSAPIHQRTGGNPLFVAEYLRTAMAEGVLARGPDASWRLRDGAADAPFDLREPASIGALISRRLHRLSDVERIVVESAAIIGRSFDEPLVSHMTGIVEGELYDALDTLRRRAIIESRVGGFVFVHDRVRDAVLAPCDEARIAALHGAAANALSVLSGDDEAHQAALAHHMRGAGRLGEAASRFERAAEHERSLFANAEAIAHYQAALACLASASVTGAVPARAAERMGELCTLAGRNQRARDAFDLALTFLAGTEREARARVLRKRAKTWESTHQHTEALADYDAAMAALDSAAEALDAGEPSAARDRHPSEWLVIQVERVWVHYWLAQVSAMVELVERVRPHIEASDDARLQSRFFQALVHHDLRRDRYRIDPATVAAARSAARAALCLPDLLAQGHARFLLGCVLTFSGSPEAGAVELEAVRALAQRVGDVTLELRALSYLATAHRLSRRIASTREYALESLRLAERLDMQDYVGVARGNLGWAHYREGARAEALVELEAALAAWALLLGKYPYPMQWIARLPLLALVNEADLALHLEAMLGAVQHQLPERLLGALAAAQRAGEIDRAALVAVAESEGYL